MMQNSKDKIRTAPNRECDVTWASTGCFKTVQLPENVKHIIMYDEGSYTTLVPTFAKKGAIFQR